MVDKVAVGQVFSEYFRFPLPIFIPPISTQSPSFWRWGRFSPSTSVSSADLHSTNFSTITIIYHLGLVH
jgi:hypothetical protein